MSNYANFQVGEKFPMPIKTQMDGGMFQIDTNGCMFILQLSRADVIAVEAFRTGKMELALYEQDGLLFFLYQIDGIFKEGWGDAPFSLSALKPEQLPTEKSLADPTLHLYLVDTNLQILLAQRDVKVSDKFMHVLRKHVKNQLAKPLNHTSYVKRVREIWAQKTSAQMRAEACAVQIVPLDIKMPHPPAKKLH